MGAGSGVRTKMPKPNPSFHLFSAKAGATISNLMGKIKAMDKAVYLNYTRLGTASHKRGYELITQIFCFSDIVSLIALRSTVRIEEAAMSNREQGIVAAAAKVFREKGYHTATTRDTRRHCDTFHPLTGLRIEGAEEERGIGAAKTKGIAHADSYRRLTRLIRDIVEIALRVWLPVINSGW